MELGSIAEWFGAIATLAAVLVALSKEEFLRYWWEPKLKISIALSPPDCHKMQITRTPEGISAECYFLRLWVENVGKTRAETIQVFVAKVLRANADGSFREVEDFFPMNLKWAYERGEIFASRISPQMGKHCDFGHLIDPRQRKLFGDDLEGVLDEQTMLSLDLEFPPSNRVHLMRPGRYQFQLKIAGSNCSMVEKTIEVTVSGNWFAEKRRMFSDGLGIRVLN